MGAYRTVIGCNFEQYENNTTNPNRYLILDTQEPKNVTVEAQIASQPLQDGDTMSDHMYRMPVTVTLTGSFSLNGKNWNDDSYNFVSMGDRLTNIQEAFERISNEGILCTLTTINEDDLSYNSGKYELKLNAKNRYKIRKNMALKSISWIENQNSVKYTFTFHEVIMVEQQAEYEELSEEEKQALGLPSVTSPKGSNLGTILVNSGVVPENIIRSLYENGYMTPEFLEKAKDTQAAILGTTIAVAMGTIFVSVVSLGIMTAVGTAVATAAATAAATAGAASVTTSVAAGGAAIFPIGTIVVGSVLAVAAFGLLIHHWVKRAKDKKEEARRREIAFKLVNGSAEPDSRRLKTLIDDVVGDLNTLQTNLTIYTINGNYEQQVILNMAGEYYIINFTKQIVSKEHFEWTATVEDMNGTVIDTYPFTPVSNIGDLNRNKNLWFRDKSKTFEVYIVNPSLDPELNNQEEILNVKEHLDSYSIWISNGDIQEQIKRVYQTIDNAITSRGYN